MHSFKDLHEGGKQNLKRSYDLRVMFTFNTVKEMYRWSLIATYVSENMSTGFILTTDTVNGEIQGLWSDNIATQTSYYFCFMKRYCIVR